MQRFKELLRSGLPQEATILLRKAVLQGELDPLAVEAAGKALRRFLKERSPEQPEPHRVLLLGQFSTIRLGDFITPWTWLEGLEVDIHEGGFNSIQQELTGLKFAPRRPDSIILLPWLGNGLVPFPAEGMADQEPLLAFWRDIWTHIGDLRISRFLQVGYDWVLPGPAPGGTSREPDWIVSRVQELNRQLIKELPQGASFLPLEALSGTLGRNRCYDLRNFFWTRSPFSNDGLCMLGRHLAASLKAMTRGPRKVLVLDLDNTLWGGVVGEVGPLGVRLGQGPDGEAYRFFQQYLRDLRSKGVLLAVCSKNNPEDAESVFRENSQMVLRREDFVAFSANWASKHENLKAMAVSLNLGLDAFVFVDDSPVERDLIRQLLPEVGVVDLPEDPAGYPESLEAGLWFERSVLTAEDHLRAAHYEGQAKRSEAHRRAATLEDYLASLDMVAHIEPIGDGNLPRALQLLAKTNQFNLTTRRHGEGALRALLEVPGTIGLAISLRDQFGDYGMIGLCLGVALPGNGPATLKIDSFLLSCRAMGRTVEHRLASCLLDAAAKAGYERVVGTYSATPRNAPCASFLQDLGFLPMTAGGESPDAHFQLALDTYRPPASFVALAEG